MSSDSTTVDELLGALQSERDKLSQMLNPEILIKYHTDAARPVEQAHHGEWFDVRAAEDYHFEAGDFQLISLGISVHVPYGYEAILAPRSSTFKNFGIIQTNSIGVIDESYSGDKDIWKMPVYATRPIDIPSGTRIAQFRIQRNQGSPKLIEVDYLGEDNRGGIGSTGIN